MILSAISPRLATRIRWNIGRLRLSVAGGWGRAGGMSGADRPGGAPTRGRRSRRGDAEQGLAELDRLAVLDQDLGDRARDAGRDLGEDLHRLDDADGGVGPDGRTDRDEGRGVGGAG